MNQWPGCKIYSLQWNSNWRGSALVWQYLSLYIYCNVIILTSLHSVVLCKELNKKPWLHSYITWRNWVVRKNHKKVLIITKLSFPNTFPKKKHGDTLLTFFSSIYYLVQMLIIKLFSKIWQGQPHISIYLNLSTPSNIKSS
jgi:hypothetical protein